MENENYYLQEFEELSEKNSFKAEQWFGKRGDLVEEYGWAIPNEEAIEHIADLSPIVEIGAGKGYWARLLREVGATVIAYDIEPPGEDAWTSVEQGTPKMLERFNGEYTLLLCWPPYGDDMAINALEAHIEQGGTDVVYVGEHFGGCTANEAFHNEIKKRYALANKITIPSYEGIHDNVYHYKRKQ